VRPSRRFQHDALEDGGCGQVNTLVLTKYLVALPYLGKVTKALTLTPSGYEMAAKK